VAHVVSAQLDTVGVHVHHGVLAHFTTILGPRWRPAGCAARGDAALGAGGARALEGAGCIPRAIIGRLGAARGATLLLVVVLAEALVRRRRSVGLFGARREFVRFGVLIAACRCAGACLGFNRQRPTVVPFAVCWTFNSLTSINTRKLLALDSSLNLGQQDFHFYTMVYHFIDTTAVVSVLLHSWG
jgi:hypothetical protein